MHLARHDGIEAMIEREATIDPVGWILIELGDSLNHKKRHDDAIVLLKICVELKPKAGAHRMYTSLAEAYLAKGEIPRARAMCQQALAIKPDYEPARTLMEDLR